MDFGKRSAALENGFYLSGSSELSGLASINDDCKARIFEYLEYKDLISIAETSKQLHIAVHDVFKRKYGNGKLLISCSYK